MSLHEPRCLDVGENGLEAETHDPMATTLGSSLPTPADATTAAVTTTTAAATAVVATTVAAAVVEDDLEDPMDVVLASALEGINLALSMDNPLGFSAMSPISQNLEI